MNRTIIYSITWSQPTLNKVHKTNPYYLQGTFLRAINIPFGSTPAIMRNSIVEVPLAPWAIESKQKSTGESKQVHI